MPTENKPLVGYGRASISPDWPIGLSGFGTEMKRISIGKLTMEASLEKGQWRELTEAELQLIFE